MRNTCRKATSIILCILLLWIPIFPLSHLPGRQVQQRSKNGLSTTTFATPGGPVVVRLPEDMRVGDTISGTVIANTDGGPSTLEGYVIEIDGKQKRLSDKIFTIVVSPSAGALPLILKNSAGTEVGRAAIPIRAAGTVSGSTLELPPFGQDGRPIEIHGPFDGDMSNTQCVIGGKAAEIIAESPRQIVVQLPSEPIGSTTISVREQSDKKTGEFRIIGVGLSAPKTQLMKGEKTTLTVQVTGLQGLKQDVPMDLITTGTVNTQGGNAQRITIQPSDVQSDGSSTVTRSLTGIETGNFNVTATVIVPISNLDGAVIHVEAVPNGGNGIWQVKVTLPDGSIVNIYIRTEQKPDLKFCNWIQIGNVTSENGTIYVGRYKKVPAPAKPPVKPPENPKPPETKPPGTTTKPPETTTEPPPCAEGAKRMIGTETKTFEVMDGSSEVSFKLYTDKDGAGDAAANMADFWKKIAKAGGILDYLPEGTGAGSTAAGWLFEYLDKGADILDALAKGKLKNLGVSKVTAEVTITTKKITAVCVTIEVCVEGKWIKQKTYSESVEKGIFRASKTAEKGGSEWDKVSQPSTPQFFDPGLAEQWARDFFKDQANILKGNGEGYAEFVKNCK